jgi:hypothetical protein
VGDPAPSISVSDPHGNRVTLDSYFDQGLTLVTFLRHFG